MDIYIVDAFTSKPFQGNPAGVCILKENIDDELMMNIARELNLSETAFALKNGNNYYIRWFTPKAEVPLCGHATLATAHILWEQSYEDKDSDIFFTTKESGILKIKYSHHIIIMDFPQKFANPTEHNDVINKAMDISPSFTGSDDIRYLVEVEDEHIVKKVTPDFELLKSLNKRVVITAHSSSDRYDFVSRVFAPSVGVNEDPVTGSAHCYLAPYWSKKLNKKILTGCQVSYRPGIVICELIDHLRVLIKGNAITIIKGKYV